jgi:hypothetical protein
MISLREQLRIHKASLDCVKQVKPQPEDLKSRLNEASRLLEYYDLTATTMLEQQQNLLSLVSHHLHSP